MAVTLIGSGPKEYLSEDAKAHLRGDGQAGSGLVDCEVPRPHAPDTLRGAVAQGEALMLTLTCALCKKRFLNMASLLVHAWAIHHLALPKGIKYEKEDY